MPLPTNPRGGYYGDDGPPVKLAPAPSEPLGEPFPLDLWSDPDELIGRDIGRDDERITTVRLAGLEPFTMAA